MTKAIVGALATASMLAISGTAHAQTATDQAPATPTETGSDQAASADQNTAGDIIVTAQRRKERVVDVPISISVADEKQLDRQQVNTIADLNRIAPSLEIQQAPQQNVGGGGQIRGIGTQTFNPGAVGSVGLVVDQVSQGNANISDIFDVARVEVLKGPQGTLFGLTASAGVINISTNLPDPTEFSGRLSTQLSRAGTLGSSFGGQVVRGVVNIPVSADSALRIAGIANLRQGVDRNAVTGDLVDQHSYSVRGRYLWTPSDALTFDVIGDYSHSDADGSDFFTFIDTDAATTALLNGCGVHPGEGNRTYCTQYPTDNRSENFGGSLRVSYDAGPFTLNSITAFRRTNNGPNHGSVFRADPLSLQVISGPTLSRVSLLTQEFRVESPSSDTLEYTVGAFLSRQVTNNRPEPFSVTLSPAPGIVIPIIDTPGAEVDVTNESMAVFGQATLHLTEKLRAIAGGRYTGSSLHVYRYDYGTNVQQTPHAVFDNVSYRFGLQYDLNRRFMAYATTARGIKGAQVAIPALPAQPYTIRPEIPTDYEVGIKGTLLGGLVMDLNAYYTKIQDYQGSECASDPVTGALSCNQINIDGVKTRGVELNFFGSPVQNLSVNTGFIWAKATYPNNYIGADGTDIGRTQLANAPEYKFTFSGQYEQPISAHLTGFLSADTVWKSRVRYEANSIEGSTFRPHWVVGGQIGIRDANDKWKAALFAHNLFDVHEPLLIQSAFPSGDNFGAIYGTQSFREVGLSLDFQF